MKIGGFVSTADMKLPFKIREEIIEVYLFALVMFQKTNGK